jgi:hypothetical protein
VLDVEGAAPDQIAAQLMHRDLDGTVAVGLGIGLAPAVNAFIGLDFDKEPVFGHSRMDQEGLDIGDFHEASSQRMQTGVGTWIT